MHCLYRVFAGTALIGRKTRDVVKSGDLQPGFHCIWLTKSACYKMKSSTDAELDVAPHGRLHDEKAVGVFTLKK